MSIKVYPPIVMDAPPTEFDEDVDAAVGVIDEACKGWGADEDALINALGKISPEMRFKVALRYKELHDGKDLADVMRSEVGRGDFGKALSFLAMPGAPAFEAYMVNWAMGGIGAKEHFLYPILAGRTNEEMNKLKQAYYEQFGEDMAAQLAANVGGDFERFIFHCLQCMEQEFDEEYHTAEQAAEDAEAFYEAGQGRWGTDEKSFFQLISKAPPKHLTAIDEIYQEKYDKNILQALDTELGGDVEKAARYAVGMKIQPYVTVAELIKSACAGFGTNELQLTAAIIRYDAVMDKVNEAHVQLFGKTVFERVDEETGGDYKKLLMAVLMD